MSAESAAVSEGMLDRGVAVKSAVDAALAVAFVVLSRPVCAAASARPHPIATLASTTSAEARTAGEANRMDQ